MAGKAPRDHTAKKDSPEQTAPPQMTTRRRSRSWSIGSLFWGLLLIVLGALFLLHNFDVVDVDLARLWSLWPLLIIVAGASLLPLRGWASAVIGGVLVIAALALVALTALGAFSPNRVHNGEPPQAVDIQPPEAESERIELAIKAGAGEVIIKADDPAVEAVRASLTSDVASLSHTAVTIGSVQKIDIQTEGTTRWWTGSYENRLNVDVTQNVPVRLTIDGGAMSLTADLSQAQLEQLRLKTGAADSEVIFGTKFADVKVELDMGASNATFRIPEGTGVRYSVEAGLSGSDLTGLKKIDDNTYESDNYTDAAQRITFTGKMGMANISLEYY